MAISAVWQDDSGLTLQVSFFQPSTGKFFDFSTGTFVSTAPVTRYTALAETTQPGLYYVRYGATPLSPAWPNGQVVAIVADSTGTLRGNPDEALIFNGDDAYVFPSGAGADPLGVDLATAGYTGTTVGALLYAGLHTTGVFLAPAGLDSVQIMAGLNARQAIWVEVMGAAARTVDSSSTLPCTSTLSVPQIQASSNSPGISASLDTLTRTVSITPPT